MGRCSDEGWDGYLTAFHSGRPGITEAVLGVSSAEDRSDPYDWLAQAVPGVGRVVDVGCGSGPLASRVAGRWIGLELNRAELALAATVAPGRLVLADATSVPLRSGEADAVVCSMALMVFDDPGGALAEIARVLRVGGVLAVLVPATTPLTARDRLRYVRLLARLHMSRLPFRHHEVLDNPRHLFGPAGLEVVSDRSRRFNYHFADPEAAGRWIQSLYLPRLDPRRHRAAERLVRRWTGSGIGLPLRRLVATKQRA